jgi:hypothetical protein
LPAAKITQPYDNLNLFRAAASACVGEVAGVEIATFIEHLEDLPDLDAIVNGESVSILHVRHQHDTQFFLREVTSKI